VLIADGATLEFPRIQRTTSLKNGGHIDPVALKECTVVMTDPAGVKRSVQVTAETFASDPRERSRREKLQAMLG
jgi:hypothetical protein